MSGVDVQLLGERLAGGGEVVLSAAEGAVVREMMLRLAASESALVRLERVCALQEGFSARVDGVVGEALRAVGAVAQGKGPMDGYDAAGARAERERLAREVERAKSGAEVIAAVLGVVRGLV